jgi:hypothetical protein
MLLLARASILQYAEGPWEVILKGFLDNKRMIDIGEQPVCFSRSRCCRLVTSGVCAPALSPYWRTSSDR